MVSPEESLSMLLIKGTILPHDSPEEEEKKKDDIDEQLLDQGISFFQHNFFSMFVILDCILRSFL